MRKDFGLIYAVVFSITVFCGLANKVMAKEPDPSREKLVYIMPENKGWQIVEQCTRSVYYPDVFWRVTEAQVQAIEKKLAKHIEKLKSTNIGFIPESLDNYKRQYIGFDLDGESFFYGNFFPKNIDLEVDPTRTGVVSCRGDQRYWGMVFSIDNFKFVNIERNDKLVKPKGAIDPRVFEEDPEPER
ncbi:MAG: hypothetical protein HWE27_09645 [Gammaproteobacteria bacterium]|nr:hypothetical protein [Gammaproteobacteria bacterium]